MFGYDIEAEIDEEFFADPRFVAHAVKLIAMFYTALGMIGPDGILLAEEIRELGEKHVNYGVRAGTYTSWTKRDTLCVMSHCLTEGSFRVQKCFPSRIKV